MQAVVLAGGAGTRLQPLTQSIPKPLLPVGPSTVLEIGLKNLRAHGVDEVFIAARYRADFVRAFLGDGSRHGLKLHVSVEDEPLGTCGPVSLLRSHLTSPFIVMNGDVLTTLSFSDLYRHAVASAAELTVVTVETQVTLPYGRVECAENRVTGVQEKPVFKVEVMAGIYVMRPSVIDLIPAGHPFGVDDLIQKMLADGRHIERFPTDAYWRDVGHIDSYHQANDEYDNTFAELVDSSRVA